MSRRHNRFISRKAASLKDKNQQLITDLVNKYPQKQEDKTYCEYLLSLSKDRAFITSPEIARNNMLKRCQSCKDFREHKNMLYCSMCQDAYHKNCVKKSTINTGFTCEKCKNIIKINNIQVEKLDKSDESSLECTAISSQNEEKNICGKCSRNIHKNQQCKECEKCKKLFHLSCFGNSQKILCQNCDFVIIKNSKAKITDFFKNVKFTQNKRNRTKDDDTAKPNNNYSASSNILNEIQTDIQIYSKVSIKFEEENLTQVSKTPLKLPKKMPKNLLEKSKLSLFRGLEAKGLKFNDDLIYLNESCPSYLNSSYLEPGIQKLSDYNKKIYYKFKENSSKGIYAPVEVIDDPVQRFIVRAIDDISQNTIITEYTGEVDLLRNQLLSNNDSIMDLIRSPNSASSLVILTEKYGNLARFLSGINNYRRNSKQNVYSIRADIDGAVHVLLLAMRKIKKGEVLYYDYNGVAANYPTQDFV